MPFRNRIFEEEKTQGRKNAGNKKDSICKILFFFYRILNAQTFLYTHINAHKTSIIFNLSLFLFALPY